jgi:hypothetical protein
MNSTLFVLITSLCTHKTPHIIRLFIMHVVAATYTTQQQRCCLP